MIVADPGAAQRRILRPGAHPQMPGPRGEALEPFQHGGDIGVGEAIIAVTALLFLLDQAAGFQLGEMRTRGLRRNAGLVGELARGQRATVISAVSMLERAGSPTSEATMAISGPAFIVR